MHLYMWPLFLATLVQSSPFSSLSSNSDTCSDFTVGWCFYTGDGLVDFYPDISDWWICESLCYTTDGCNYFRWSKYSQKCKMYTFSQNCNRIGGAIVLRLRIVFRNK